MTNNIIYHDFRNNAPATPTTESTMALTANMLAAGRRLANIRSAVNIACVALCGACIGVSLLILTTLLAC